jgi:hypothetical protein
MLSGLSAIRIGDTRRKVFISYYHDEDEFYRTAFETAHGHLFINKSVRKGDIDPDNSDQYVKRLILEDYITDASVVMVLVGPNTKKRKHVDWEISAGLNKKVGGYSGLVGILLPEFPINIDKYYYSDLPPRLSENVQSGFANVYDWKSSMSSGSEIKRIIENAFEKRNKYSSLIRNSDPLFKYNRA